MRLNRKKTKNRPWTAATAGRLCFIILYISFSFCAETISLSKTELELGENLQINVQASENIKYIYAKFTTGEGYLLDKIPGGWSKSIIIPEYFTEGVYELAIITVLNNLEEVTYIKRISIQDSGRTNPEITFTPERVQAGQKVLVRIRYPQATNKASLVYAGENYSLQNSDSFWWSTELIATNNTKLKAYFQTETTTHEELFDLPLFIPQAETTSQIKNITEEPKPEIKPTSNFSIHGNKTIIWVNKSKTGDNPDFKEEHSREESLNLDINGKENSVNIEAQIFSTTQENVDKKDSMKIRFYTDTWEGFLGDFSQTISCNELTLKNKNLTGFRFSYFPQNDYLMVLNANQQGDDQTEYIYGNDSQGPYYLNKAPIVLGSEKVYLDNILLTKDKDYSIEYQSGKIILRNNVLTKQQSLKVDYEATASAFNNRFSAAHYHHDFGWLQLGGTFLNSRDNPYSGSVVSGSATTPSDKKLSDIETKFRLGFFVLELEGARSEVKPDITNTASTLNTAEARHAKFSYDNKDNFKFNLASTLVDKDFVAIGNKDLFKGLDDNRGDLELRVSNDMILRAEQFKQEYETNNQIKNKFGYYKFQKSEQLLPEINFWAKDNQQTIIDKTPSANTIALRKYHIDSIEMAKTISQNFRIGIKGSKESAEDMSQEYRFLKTETTGGYIQTQGFSKADFIVGTDHSKKDYLNSDKIISLNATRDESYTRLNIYPDSRFRMGTSYRYINDSAEGNSEISDVDYVIAPDPGFRTNGQYSIESLKEAFASQNYRVQNQKGNFGLRWLPGNWFKATLRYSPNLSIVKAKRDIVNSFFEVKNGTLDYAPVQFASLKYNYLANRSFTRDNTQIEENILRTEDSLAEKTTILKILPHEKVDLEFKYRNSDIINNDINDSNTANIYYTDGHGDQVEKGLNVYVRPNRDLLTQVGYSTELARMTFENEPSLNEKLNRYTYSADAKYKLDQAWTLHLFGSYLKTTDLIKPTDNITYEYAPGIGISYKINLIKFSYDYTKTESFLGEKILNHKHDLGFDYDYNEYIHFNLICQHIHSEYPRFDTTDVLTRFSATF